MESFFCVLNAVLEDSSSCVSYTTSLRHWQLRTSLS
nr:MAG TPA: hypothetical protein [Caudoviricetes sp.]